MSLESIKALLKKHSSIFKEEELNQINSILEEVNLRLSESVKLKEEGNKAYQEKEYLDAVDLYTKALKIDPTNEIFYSNRSAAYAKINCEESGIDDSLKALEYNPNFILSYLRLGDFYKTSDKSKSLFYYKVGLVFDPKNEKLLQRVSEFKDDSKNELLNSDNAKEVMNSNEFKNMFNKVMEDKELMEKLANLNKK